MTPRPRLNDEQLYELALLEVERDRGPDRRAADASYWQMVLGRTVLNSSGLFAGLCAHFREATRGRS